MSWSCLKAQSKKNSFFMDTMGYLVYLLNCDIHVAQMKRKAILNNKHKQFSAWLSEYLGDTYWSVCELGERKYCHVCKSNLSELSPMILILSQFFMQNLFTSFISDSCTLKTFILFYLTLYVDHVYATIDHLSMPLLFV